jgi:hypothetical protein
MLLWDERRTSSTEEGAGPARFYNPGHALTVVLRTCNDIQDTYLYEYVCVSMYLFVYNAKDSQQQSKQNRVGVIRR